MNLVERFRAAFALRPVLGIHRELRRLNDSLDALMLHFHIPTKKELLLAQKDAASEAEKIDRNPQLLVTSTPAQLAAEQLRERVKRGEGIEGNELLAVSDWLKEEEEKEDVAW